MFANEGLMDVHLDIHSSPLQLPHYAHRVRRDSRGGERFTSLKVEHPQAAVAAVFGPDRMACPRLPPPT